MDNEDLPESGQEKEASKRKNDNQTTKPKPKKTKKNDCQGQGSSSGAPTSGGSAGDNGSKRETSKAKLPTAKHKEAAGGER